MNLHPALKNPWLLSAAVGAIALTGSTAFYTLSLRPTQPASPEVVTPAPARISALGRLEPEAEIIQLAPWLTDKSYVQRREIAGIVRN
jgi:hypothetical protein